MRDDEERLFTAAPSARRWVARQRSARVGELRKAPEYVLLVDAGRPRARASKSLRIPNVVKL